MPRSPRPSLEVAIADRGFTPSTRDLEALIDLLADDARAKHAERAIARLGPIALERLEARFEGAKPPLRGRIVRVIGRLANDGTSPRLTTPPSADVLSAPPGRGQHLEQRARIALVAALDDHDPKTRRNAAIALGHANADGVEEALLAAWRHDPRPEMRRSIAASLGKIGGTKALVLLRDEASHSADPEMARIVERAVMMLERTASRSEPGRLVPGRLPPRPTDVIALSRRGLEDMLAEELALVDSVRDVRVTGPGKVRGQLVGAMEAMFSARTMLSFSFPLPQAWRPDGESEQEAIARVVASDEARAILANWTAGTVRYRIAWADGGHRRAATWGLAQAIARRAPDLMNDPTGSLWEVVIETYGTPAAGAPHLPKKTRCYDVAIAPRVPDPRFVWRVGDVPAASHPTVAAALARVGGIRDDDVVWDPFVGSGAELVERALLGPYRALLGSDSDTRALVVAAGNLAAAHLVASIERADAVVHSPPGVTLIVTNPPMGRRASRVAGLADELDRFVAHAASVLLPGGRLVWIAPWPARTRDVATRAGLKLERAFLIDMGGFDAEMQRWVK
jgi:DNA-directed RNA polymerase specialized sigma24 family protein